MRSESPSLEPPTARRTNPLTWLGGVACVIMWIAIITGGLTILIMYLFYRPRTPLVDISTATLDAVYVDSSNLLNADITLLSNFTNPNRKVDVAYDSIMLDVYYNGTLVAAQGVAKFEVRRGGEEIRMVHLVASGVQLGAAVANGLRIRVVGGGDVGFDVLGRATVTSNFGGFIKVKYLLHVTCSVVFRSPPTGVLRSKRCRTKR